MSKGQKGNISKHHKSPHKENHLQKTNIIQSINENTKVTKIKKLGSFSDLF